MIGAGALGAAPATASGPARALRPMAITPTSGPAGTTITASSATESCIHHGINDPSVSWPGKVRLVLGHVNNTLDSPNEDQWIDPLVKADSIANPDGTWSATIQVPADAPLGSYDVAAICFLPFGRPPWAPTTTAPSTTAPSTTASTTTTSAPTTSVAPARQPSPRTLDSWVIYQPVTFAVVEAEVAGDGSDATPATPVGGSAGYTG